MCHDDASRPPASGVEGGIAEGGDLVLRSADGSEFGVFFAHPDRPSDAGVVILPDVRGLHPFYKELAKRFAEAGLHAVAIDYFGRTAGIGLRDDQFPFREHFEKLTPDQLSDDVGAAVDWLRNLEPDQVRAVFTLGFCFGGAMSWRQSAARRDLAGCIGFYGRPDRAADTIESMTAPLLLLAGGQDHIPVPDVEAFAAEVQKAGVPAELHVYPKATHSFFDKRYEEFAEESADAWRRVLDFVSRYRG